jgi:hypothetical protein
MALPCWRFPVALILAGAYGAVNPEYIASDPARLPSPARSAMRASAEILIAEDGDLDLSLYGRVNLSLSSRSERPDRQLPA